MNTTTEQIQHIFTAWDEALGAKDVDAAVALYRPDATLESPLVCHLLGTEPVSYTHLTLPTNREV